MTFLVSAKTPLCHKVMDDHILQSRHEIKDADELETFREGFVGLCWLDGPNSLISMLYLSYLMWCGSWEHDVMSVCSVFRLPFLLHVDMFWNSILESGWPFCSWFWGWSRELCSQDGADIGWCICIGSVDKYNSCSILLDIRPDRRRIHCWPMMRKMFVQLCRGEKEQWGVQLITLNVLSIYALVRLHYSNSANLMQHDHFLTMGCVVGALIVVGTTELAACSCLCILWLLMKHWDSWKS